MFSTLGRAADAFFRRGAFGATVAVLDGPLRPNQALEQAARIFSADSLDNMVSIGDRVIYSSGERLLERLAVDDYQGEAHELARFDVVISSVAVHESGAIAVGLNSGGVVILGGPHNGRRIIRSETLDVSCPTALQFLDADTLVVANGSALSRASDWKRDLMSHGSSGSVSKVDIETSQASILASQLGFPLGLAVTSLGNLLVSTAWEHRVIEIGIANGGRSQTILGDLPGYPARLIASRSGGYWLSLFAIRTQLTEFVLREHEYRERMMKTIPTAYWVGPDLTSGKSFLEPLQGGSIKQMGILKPWAPPRSYGLIVRCDANMQPVSSFHSRADGSVHGVMSMCEAGKRLLVGAKGPGLAVALDLPEPSKEGDA